MINANGGMPGWAKRCVRRLGMALMLVSFVARAEEITLTLDTPATTGTVTFLLFDSANTFGDSRDSVKTVTHKMEEGAVCRIQDVPPGQYAIVAYYDANANGRMDRNFIGIPSEPVGFSNGYRPKGPPQFTRAAFVLVEGDSKHFDVTLAKPLGECGRIGAGVGIITRTSPYRDYDGEVSQMIPAITYNGNRVQIFGPTAQVGLTDAGAVRLALVAQYRLGAYEEDDSDFLEGMGDADDTLMLGLASQAELPGGVDLSLRYSHDALDAIGGGEAQMGVDKSFQVKRVRLSPQVGVNWMSRDVANNDFGVSLSQARPDRPAYEPGDVISFELGLGLFAEVRRDWLIVLNTGIEQLADEVRDSPIVEEDYVLKSFGAINYVF